MGKKFPIYPRCAEINSFFTLYSPFKTRNGVALNESALMQQFVTTVAEKDSEISRLKAEKDSLASKIISMKERFKKMMSVLDQAEFKEKVVLAAEVEKLKKVISWLFMYSAKRQNLITQTSISVLTLLCNYLT